MKMLVSHTASMCLFAQLSWQVNYGINLVKKALEAMGDIFAGAFLLWRSYSAGYDSADTAWKLQWAQRDLSDSTAALHRDISERAEEQRRQNAINQITRDASYELDNARRNIANAEHAADGLRDSLDNLQQQFRISEKDRLSAVTCRRTAEARVRELLAQLLRESDNAAGKYAAEADQSRIAGEVCEKAYEQIILMQEAKK